VFMHGRTKGAFARDIKGEIVPRCPRRIPCGTYRLPIIPFLDTARIGVLYSEGGNYNSKY